MTAAVAIYATKLNVIIFLLIKRRLKKSLDHVCSSTNGVVLVCGGCLNKEINSFYAFLYTVIHGCWC